MMNLESKCRSYCRRQKINPDMLASKSWQGIPGPRTRGMVLMWHTVISEVIRKPYVGTASKDSATQGAELQRMIDESNPKKRYSVYDGEDK